MRFRLISGFLAAGIFGVLALDPNVEPQAPFISPTLSSEYISPNSSPFEPHAPCNHEVSDDIFLDYRRAFYDMANVMYKKIAEVNKAHFVYSPQTTWLTLAAVAEGTSGPTRRQLFDLLHLPEDICVREAYYHLASTREHSSTDIVLARKRLFVADSSVHVNKEWEDYAKTYANIDTVSAPFKSNPVFEIDCLKKLLNVRLPNLNITGNSLLMESFDYAGMWTSVFSDAVIEEGPFYNSNGEQVGVMEYMKVYKRANIGFMPSLNMKIIDLPVGREGRYRLYFLVLLSPKDNFEQMLTRIESSIVMEAIANLKQSLEPVQIVIPKIKMTSELDLRYILEEVGIKSLWTDPLATRNISEPAALPSAFTQRVTVNIDEGGVRPSVKEYHNFIPPRHVSYFSKPDIYTGHRFSELPEYNNPLELSSFVANKPFMFGVFDSVSSVGLMYGAFSQVHN